MFWQAVQLKANYPMSYADCFAAALAIVREATSCSKMLLRRRSVVITRMPK